MNPVSQLQGANGGDHLLDIHLPLDDHRRQNEQRKILVDLPHRVITALVEEADEPGLAADVLHARSLSSVLEANGQIADGKLYEEAVKNSSVA
jgi:hypothetical protein